MFIQYLIPENLSKITITPSSKSSPVVDELKAIRKKHQDYLASLRADLFTCDSIGISAFSHIENQIKVFIDDINKMIKNHEN